MVIRKNSPPKTQQTLLSFFARKADSAPSANGTCLATTKLATSLKRNLAVTDSTPTKSRSRKNDNDSKTDDHDEDEPLFPPGFSTIDDHSAPTQPSANPPTQDMSLSPMDLSESTSTARSTAKAGKRTLVNNLSKFGYKAAGADQNQPKPMSAEQQHAQEARHERFRKKLGDPQTPTQAQDTESTTSTSRRRRLIMSESDDDDSDGEGDGSQVSATRQNRQQPKHITQQQPSKSTTMSRNTSAKKATKSVYTPLEKQFMEIKEQHPDAILCIEVGYKFRFFGEDAQIASRELSIAHFMDHNFYTASIPIHRLDVHVRRLVHSGHKVGIVRQLETAALKAVGNNKSAPFARKLTNLYTKATFLESLDQDEKQLQGSFAGIESSSQYIMCLCEQPQGGTGADEKVKLAMIAVQPATGDIIYDEFLDGHFRNELETRLLHIQPTELIVPMERMSNATESLLKHLTTPSRRSAGSVPGGQDDVRIERTAGFVKYDKAFTTVSTFYSDSLKDEQLEQRSKGATSVSTKHSQMEVLLKTVLGLSRNLIVALAAMITHLTDFGLAPVFRLSKYFECFTSRSHMLLNGNTISNLEIYRNQTDWTSRGSLFAILDHTMTGFGRRLLKKWVGKPLIDRVALQERIDAVEEILSLAGKNTYLENTRRMLKGLMDLEKGVCRIHYGKSLPKEFLTIIKTFVRVSEVNPRDHGSSQHSGFGLTSPVLRRLIGSLSHAAEDSQYFLDGLNEEATRKDDKLHMFQEHVVKEKWPEILEHKDNIVATEEELSVHLESIQKQLREPRLEFTSVSGIDYLVEVKNRDVAKVPKSWVKVSGTKQVSRFHTPETIQLIQAKAQHQERLTLACDRAFAAFQQEFSERYEVFRDLVQNLAILDCLFSLAVVACMPGYVKPEYVDDDNQDVMDVDQIQGQCTQGIFPMESDAKDLGEAPLPASRQRTSKITIDIQHGRHPMVEQMLPPGNFVANDIWFGTQPSTGVDEKAMIITGPNMGGKSCYIRQVALLCIMAQIGSYLPADSARVSLLDAVYTRMGASDNIFGHESTFMVELQETSDILKMATSRSLVILDELGRGTSTLDGVAIAYAVLSHIVAHIDAITLFVTHYPSLADVAKEFPEGRVRNYHMGFMASVERSTSRTSLKAAELNETMDEPILSAASDSMLDDMDIVFLYKLVRGVSLKSYGLNVARMAKLPLPLITRAKAKSKELEIVLEQRAEQRKRKRRAPAEEEEEEEEEQRSNAAARQTWLTTRMLDIFGCRTEEQAIALQARMKADQI
ncbi:Mismatch repair protein msh3 [Mortierella polycephala]|uniref:DNA mismatch repair protein MSH3 n=1 Tax=Mortierella polycephala TaxID=41804 RepID=A0A9P6Q6Z4_9FUNG|nr:Mismatch repair protein msh3 [Mortierella polycephala]